MTAADEERNLADYAVLREILDRAYGQSANGKGRERHANALPFAQQPIAQNGRRFGTGFNLGQASKKQEEAFNMLRRGENDAAVRELLGAIVYTASAVMLIEELSPRP